MRRQYQDGAVLEYSDVAQRDFATIVFYCAYNSSRLEVEI